MNPVEPGASIGRVIDGKFRLVRAIGADGGVLRYLAEHTGIERPVEVHLLRDGESSDSEAGVRLLGHAKVAGRAAHRNLQGVVDTGTERDGSPYVVYEAMNGATLADLIRSEPGGLDEALGCAIVSSTLEGVRALHHVGVVVRTLRPEHINVRDMKGNRPVVKVATDYGAVVTGRGPAERVPRTGRTTFLAPELAGDARPALDARADLYSIGRILELALAGTRQPGRPLSGVARRTVDRATALDPTERFVDADAFFQAITLLTSPERTPSITAPIDPLVADLGYLRLRRTTQRRPASRGDGETRLHLLPVLMTIEAIYRRYGADVWAGLRADVPEADSLLPGAGQTAEHTERGVPSQLFASILVAVDRLVGHEDLALVPEFGAAVAARLPQLDPDLPSDIGPDGLIDAFPRLWSKVSRSGRAAVRRLKPGEARLSVRAQLTPSLELAGFTAGLIREALRRTGAREAKVTLISSEALGDAQDLYGVTWS